MILIFSSSSLSHIYLHLYSQTLTRLDLSSNQIGDAGAQYLADALRDNKVILIFSSSLSLISIFISIHRHSPCCTLTAIKSEMLELNISLMHYEITRWFSFSLHLSLSHIYLHLYSQTLTRLNLSCESNRRCWSSISRWCITR